MPADLIGAVLDGRYKVVERVAEGAMGIVYRGERLKLGRAVAIKFLHVWNADDAAARKRFEVEARAMARLEHPHCAAVIDFGEYEGAPYVVMDFIRGVTLRELIDYGPIEPIRAAEIMKQVLSGLAHAHDLEIVHRDVKPANIMISEKTGLGDTVKILDFGLARLRGSSAGLTVGMAIGTPSYMAPEQIVGGAVDARTDLYACGILLFEMLTGDKPFTADEPLEVLRMHRELAPPRASSRVSDELRVRVRPFDDLIARTLEKRPDDRFASAAELSAAIDAAMRAVSVADADASRRHVDVRLSDRDRVVSVTSREGMPDRGDARATIADGDGGGERVADGDSSRAKSADDARGRAGITDRGGEGAIEGADEGRRGMREPSGEMSGGSIRGDAASSGTAREASRDASRDGDRRRRLVIGASVAAGALVAIGVIAAVASGVGGGAAEIDAGVVVAAKPDASAESDDVLARARAMVESGDSDGALRLLDSARRTFPDRAALSYEVGRLYFARLWWRDGMAAFRAAIRVDPGYRTDPDLIKTVLRGFITTPDTDEGLARFLRNDIGEAAIPYLQETAESNPSAKVRARAAALLERYR
ncbi:MAG TPA: protein kinase [Kofleriaceae bacterium]|nr:protein kinase [Kofleriaceae bacterium]